MRRQHALCVQCVSAYMCASVCTASLGHEGRDHGPYRSFPFYCSAVAALAFGYPLIDHINVLHTCKPAGARRFVAETALEQTRLQAASAQSAAGLTGKQWFASQEAAGHQVSVLSCMCCMLPIRPNLTLVAMS